MADGDPESQLLLNCLCRISMADGELHANETAMMIAVIEQATGIEVDVDALVASVLNQAEAVTDAEIARLAKLVNPDFRRGILKACVALGEADAVVIDFEKSSIQGIAELLQVSITR